ncbi:MAG: arsenate reductase ArsC [Thiobacillus sp.]|nr:arsenate reductase ArsC [Thiobacillus sp.]
MHKPIRILFVCDGVSARSRMAEALLRAADDERFEIHSAGIEAEALNPLAVEIMREIDMDIPNEPIAALNDFEDMQFDYVITLCDEAKASCLAFPRDGHNLHWTCAVPGVDKGSDEQQRAAYRQVRDTLKQQIKAWLETLEKE